MLHYQSMRLLVQLLLQMIQMLILRMHTTLQLLQPMQQVTQVKRNQLLFQLITLMKWRQPLLLVVWPVLLMRIQVVRWFMLLPLPTLTMLVQVKQHTVLQRVVILQWLLMLPLVRCY